MPLRDLPFSPYHQLQLFDGLDPAVVQRLPAAIEASLADPAAAVRVGARRRADPAASLETHPAGWSFEQLIVRAHRRSAEAPAGCPFTVTASGSRAVIGVPHGAMDGRVFLEFTRFALARASGGRPVLDADPAVRLPFLGMLREHMTVDLWRSTARAAEAVPGPEVGPPSPADLRRETARFVAVRLTDGDLGRLAATSFRGTSTAVRVSGLAVAALARVHRGTEDMTVTFPIDLRRSAAKGRITGDFVSVGPLGTLMASDWSAKAVTVRLSAEIRSKLPIVRAVRGVLATVRHRPVERLGALLGRPEAIGRGTVSMSILSADEDYADAAWLPGAPRLSGGVAVGGPWPSATFVCALVLGGAVRISVWDEAGLFDVDRFSAALEEELSARERVATTAR